MSHLVFVYGTLKRGFSNHHILKDAEFLGSGETTESVFTMYHLGGFPGVVLGGNSDIKGELYSVDEATLQHCDWLEGHPNFYKRLPVEVKVGSEFITAWMYIYQHNTGDREVLEEWK